MTPLALTSITAFILAAGTLFLAGLLAGLPKARFSAAWFWNGMLLLLGLGALIAGIDHGFFESAGLPHYAIQRGDWIVLGGMTFCVLAATARQFFAPPLQRIVLVVAAAQFAVNAALVLLLGNYLTVTLNYAPVMVLLLVINSVRLRSAGSWEMSAAILVLFSATGIQASGFDSLSPLDHNGLYHVVSMPGVLLLFLAGRRLKTGMEQAERQAIPRAAR